MEAFSCHKQKSNKYIHGQMLFQFYLSHTFCMQVIFHVVNFSFDYEEQFSRCCDEWLERRHILLNWFKCSGKYNRNAIINLFFVSFLFFFVSCQLLSHDVFAIFKLHTLFIFIRIEKQKMLVWTLFKIINCWQPVTAMVSRVFVLSALWKHIFRAQKLFIENSLNFFFSLILCFFL